MRGKIPWDHEFPGAAIAITIEAVDSPRNPVQYRNTVLEAIKKLGHTVSAADVAAATGLSLFDARTTLNKVALETKAVLEVSPRGEISYKFYPDLESIYKIV